MRIKQILSQHRRDFTAIYQCQHCGHEERGSGYDDAHFHTKVVPDMTCKKCNRAADKSFRPLMTKYPEGLQL